MIQYPIASSELSAEEIETVRSYLERTRGELVGALSGLTADQWTFKPSSESWCIAEVVEHQVLTERTIHSIIGRLADAPEPPPDWSPRDMDQLIPTRIPSRSRRGKAPESLVPTGCWSGAEALAEFVGARTHTLELVSASCLRGRVIPHPVFGFWDGYHWLLAAAAHGSRHTGQIAEIKSHPNFPG